MYRKFPIYAIAAFGFLSLTATSCSDNNPAGPTPPGSPGGTSELKATAPQPLSPTNDVTVNGLKPTFEIANASGLFVDLPYSYAFEVQTDSGSVVREATMSGTRWDFPDNLETDRRYRWRVRAVLDGVYGPWSETATFRTRTIPGCENGRLTDMRAYFFHVIGRNEGDPAHDWQDVMRRSGIPAGPVAGQIFPHNAPFYGLSQQISSSGQLRGRVFLPTDRPNPFGYYIQDVDFLSDASGSRWAWRPHGSPPYSPRPCP